MATEFILPELGEGIKEGTLVKILVKEGDRVEENQNVLELETDKAVLEVPSTVSGVVQSLAVQEGSKVKIGQSIFSVQADATTSTPAPAAASEKAQAALPEPSTPTPVEPDSSQETSDNEAAPAVSATPPVPPPSQQGERSARAAAVSATSGEFDPVPASPSMRRLARELGVDIRAVAGSGPSGRVSETDIKAHARGLLAGNGVLSYAAPAVASGAAGPLPEQSKWGAVERQELSGIRRATAEQMVRAWQAPHVTQFDKADITDLEALRKKYAPQAEKRGGKLTVTAVLIKVIVAALRQFPQFNSSLDLEKNELVLKKYFHIGVAVDTERGLLVPVIRDADRKGIFEIATELGEIAERARNRKTSLEEMQGGCFTVTNLGGIGGTSFTPIINTPEVAILGVARGAMEPKWNGEGFAPRFVLPLALSYDHRVIDGADGARFLRFVAQALEEPFLLALGS